MSQVTFQVLEGLERGEVYWDLPTPVTIGREEDNHVRLNDERVSRFHAKVQEDEERIILTDLESTNGTRVNGHAIKMRVLQIGDQVQIGRCLLLYGSPKQIEARIREGGGTWTGDQTVTPDSGSAPAAEPDPESGSVDADVFEDPFPQGPPELPQNLSGVHAAQLSDMLAYVHSRVLHVLLSVAETPAAEEQGARVVLPDASWHELQELEMRLSTWMRGVADPSDQGEA